MTSNANNPYAERDIAETSEIKYTHNLSQIADKVKVE